MRFIVQNKLTDKEDLKDLMLADIAISRSNQT